jgi:hypothetical protein
MIGQRADALLLGNAKQRSALFAFLRSSVVGRDVQVAACSARGRRRAVRLECEREVSHRSGAAGSKSACSTFARVQNTTAVHIKDLSLGKLEHAATPGTALGVDGAVRARVRFASQQRCVESDACRADSRRAVASSCLLCAPCWPALATDAPTRAATCCLLCARRCWRCRCREDFRLQTCARLLIAINSPTD